MFARSSSSKDGSSGDDGGGINSNSNNIKVCSSNGRKDSNSKPWVCKDNRSSSTGWQQQQLAVDAPDAAMAKCTEVIGP